MEPEVEHVLLDLDRVGAGSVERHLDGGGRGRRIEWKAFEQVRKL